MNAAQVRPEIELGPIRPPQRLAPFSYALGAEVKRDGAEADTAVDPPAGGDGEAFGRLILLHDPEGADAWDGTMRLVAFVQADLDPSEAVDPLLPEVAWSWLVDALEARSEQVTALGGTVTATTSVISGTTGSNALTAITNIDNALSTVNSERTKYGGMQNRFEAIIGNLQVGAEAQAAARSRIMDADFAQETARLTRSQIMQQASTAMLAQANASPQSVLSLLRQ